MKTEGLGYLDAQSIVAKEFNFSPGIIDTGTPTPGLTTPWKSTPNLIANRSYQSGSIFHPNFNIGEIPTDRLNFGKHLHTEPGFLRSRGWTDDPEILKQNDYNWLIQREHRWWDDGGEY